MHGLYIHVCLFFYLLISTHNSFISSYQKIFWFTFSFNMNFGRDRNVVMPITATASRKLYSVGNGYVWQCRDLYKSQTVIS